MRQTFIGFLAILFILSSGCHSLRKKFVRKKKGKKEAPVYVDFKDYPTRPSREAYIDYYLFVRGWLEELRDALRREFSYKREMRAINEAIMNTEQIISFYNTAGKEKIYPFYEELLAIKKQITMSPNMSEMKRTVLIRKIEHVKRRFEKNFNYTDAEKWMD